MIFPERINCAFVLGLLRFPRHSLKKYLNRQTNMKLLIESIRNYPVAVNLPEAQSEWDRAN